MSDDKVILSLDEVPNRATIITNLMLTLPDLKPKEVSRLPNNYKNMYVLIKHKLFKRSTQPRLKQKGTQPYDPQKIEWDDKGWPYIIINKRHLPLDWLDGDKFLDFYLSATDFCNECGYPLDSIPDDVLSWSTGDVVAEVFICKNCREHIRREF